MKTKILKRYVGQYKMAADFILTVTLVDTTLHLQATGQPSIAIFPASNTEFFAKAVRLRRGVLIPAPISGQTRDSMERSTTRRALRADQPRYFSRGADSTWEVTTTQAGHLSIWRFI